MTDFYFVTLEKTGASTILDTKTIPRFICFKYFKTARVYAKYLSRHRGVFGKWPCVDLSKPMSKIDPPEGYTPSDSTDFDDLLSLRVARLIW